jgi:putative tryptophan/tyrosine transport system substrate-binding protein
LPALAADLVGRHVALIVTYTDAAALAAKAATTTIPIVFVNGGDPVRAGIVHSLNRPGDNITGVSFYGVDLAPKQLSLLHELVPKAEVVGLLIDQNVPDAVAQVPGVQDVGQSLGLQLIVLKAGVANDIDAAFETLVRERAGALLVGTGALLTKDASKSLRWRNAMGFPRCIRIASLRRMEACSVTAITFQILFAKPAIMPGGFSRATSPPICR